MTDTAATALPSAADLDAVEAEKQIRWRCILEAIPDVEAWNRNLGEFKRISGTEPGFREYAMAEAERRGYLWSKVSKCFFHPFPMKACLGKSVIGVGWQAPGRLAVVLAKGNGSERWESVEANVPAKIADNLARSPYPDHLFWDKKSGYSVKYLMRRVM